MSFEIYYSFTASKSIAVNALALDKSNNWLAISQNSSKRKTATLIILNLHKKVTTVLETTVDEYFGSVYDLAWSENKLFYWMEEGPNSFVFKMYEVETQYSKILYRANHLASNIHINKFNDNVYIYDTEIFEYNTLTMEKNQFKTPKGYKNCFIFTDQLCWLSEDKKLIIQFGFLQQQKLYEKQLTFSTLVANEYYTFALGEYFNGVFVWETGTGKPVDFPLFNHPEQIFYSCALDSNLALLGGRIGHLYVINMNSKEIIYRERIHTGSISALCCSADGNMVVSGGNKGEIIILKRK